MQTPGTNMQPIQNPTSSVIASTSSAFKASAPINIVKAEGVMPGAYSLDPTMQAPSGIPSFRSTVISVGGGPRFSNTVRSEIAFPEKHHSDFEAIQALGGKYEIVTTGFERQSAEYVGRGVAWGPDQGRNGGGGTANTAAEVPNKGIMEKFLVGQRESLAETYLTENNVVAAAVQLTSFRSGHRADGQQVTLHRASGTRSALGELELNTLHEAIAEAAERFPFYHVEIFAGIEISEIDLNAGGKPGVFARHTGSADRGEFIQADTVRLNTGTTPGNPLRDEAVKAHSLVRPMDPTAVGQFLEAKNLLQDGAIKPGTRLALGGTNLSFYDELIAVLAHTPGLVVFAPDTQLGYRVDQSVAARYQGLLTAISNSQKWIEPRHSYGVAWTQAKDPLATPEELHAAFLHQDGQEVFRSWATVADASVGSTMNLTPGQVDRQGMTALEILQAQRTDNATHLDRLDASARESGPEKQRLHDAASQTLDGAKRQAYASTVLGFGPSRDPAATVAELGKKAPFTYLNRNGYLMERAQLSAVTTPGTQAAADNGELINTHNKWLQAVIASPPVVHSIAAELATHGVLGHVAANYGGFSAGSSGQSRNLSLRATDGSKPEFDAFLVAPTLTRVGDPALASLKGQILPADARVQDLPTIASQRRIVAADGTPSRVEDFGFNGVGAWASRKSKVGAFAFEVNNRDSSVADGPRMAAMRMAAAHLKAAGFSDPEQEVANLFDARIPSDEQYAKEVKQFARPFESLQRKARLVEAAAIGAPSSGVEYARLTRFATSGADVKLRTALWEGRNPDMPVESGLRLKGVQHLSEGNGTEVPFDPAPKSAYFARFVDSPQHVCDAVYADALKMAVTRLKSNVAP
jgi:hypothetical protein